MEGLGLSMLKNKQNLFARKEMVYLTIYGYGRTLVFLGPPGLKFRNDFLKVCFLRRKT